MNSILLLILDNLKMVALFIIPFICVRLSDILFGLVITFKDNTPAFDYRKFLLGILKSIVTILGMATLISGAVLLPQLLNMYNITFVNTELLASMVNVISVLSIIVTSIITYGRDSYQKLLVIFNIKDPKELINLKRIDENGDEDVSYS